MVSATSPETPAVPARSGSRPAGGRVLGRLTLGVAMLGAAACQPGAEGDQKTAGTTAEEGNRLAPKFSTYVSGARGAEIRDVATDAQGNIYLTGGTASPDFPVTSGAFQTTHNPGRPEHSGITPTDVFVMKLAPRGGIVWSTFIGGPNHDRAYAIEVDRSGYVYVAGRAGAGFPVTAGACQTSFMGGQEASFYGPQDGFVCKLEPGGSAVVFCSYFGTADPRIVRDLAVDDTGDIYIAAGYSSGVYPPALQRAFTNGPRGDQDAVVAKIASDGSRLIWATHVGGSKWDGNQNSIRLDGAGNPHILITTRSPDAPTTAGAFQPRHAGDADLYVAKLTPDGGRLVWATYLGGRGEEATETHELAVDAPGNAYVVAPTRSPDFPTTASAFQKTYGGGPSDIAIAKLSAGGTTLLGGTFLGGTGSDKSEGVAVDPAGHVYLTGGTTSPDFPVTGNAFQPRRPPHGKWDAVAAVLSADFSRLIYSTYLGGRGDDFGRAAALDARRTFYVGGWTSSRDWPVLNARPASARGPRDAFIAGFVLGPETAGARPPPVLLPRRAAWLSGVAPPP